MTTKDLWKTLGLAFECWLIYVIFSALVSVLLPSFLEWAGDLAVGVLCLYVFISSVAKRLKGEDGSLTRMFRAKKSGQTSENRNVKTPSIPVTNIKQAQKAVVDTTPKAFKKEMRSLKSQVDRMDRKTDQIELALKEYFGDSKISYEKFMNTVNQMEDLFLKNTQKVINRIDIFDEDGYREIFARHQEYTSAIEPYNEYFKYVHARLEENDQILSKLDKLLLEVSQLSESQVPIDQLPAMLEINDLIEQTKLYRH